MTGNEYQEQAMRTNDGRSTERLVRNMVRVPNISINVPTLLNGCLGLAGESGEFLDIVKKWLFHEKPIDEEHMKKELGDVFWYTALICDAMGWSMDEIMQMNIDKLKARYPEGFDTEKSNHRKEGDV